MHAILFIRLNRRSAGRQAVPGECKLPHQREPIAHDVKGRVDFETMIEMGIRVARRRLKPTESGGHQPGILRRP